MADIICPNQNCNYRGPTTAEKHGSILLFIFLLCLGIIPGLLYLLYLALVWERFVVCPKCGVMIRPKY